MRFSIKTLLILTVVVAVWVLAGKFFWDILPSSDSQGNLHSNFDKFIFAFLSPPLFLFGIGFIPAGILGYLFVLSELFDKDLKLKEKKDG